MSDLARQHDDCAQREAKFAFRQWDLKLVNALNYIQPGYGGALDKLKECIDRGQDLEDVRPGAASDISAAHFGTALIESLRGMNLQGAAPLDVERLNADLELILIEKARAKSDILQRLTNLQNHGCVDVCGGS